MDFVRHLKWFRIRFRNDDLCREMTIYLVFFFIGEWQTGKMDKNEFHLFILLVFLFFFLHFAYKKS